MKAGTVNELLDMLTFAVGMQILKLKMEEGIFDRDTASLAVKYSKAGMKLGRAINSSKSFGMTLSENWKDLEINGAKISGVARLYNYANKSVFTFEKSVEFFGEFALKWLSRNNTSPFTLSTLFTQTLNFRLIKQIAILAEAGELDDALAKFKNLAGGKGKATKRLVQWASGLHALSESEGSLADEIDAGSKNDQVGANLGRAKKKLTETDNSDPDERLNAERELAEAEQEANETINNSPTPDKTKQQIINKAVLMQTDLGFGVNDDSGYAWKTAVGAKYGLNSEQEAMLTSSGKVIMAAGAGAGKTHTLTALVEHMCTSKRDGGKGIRPKEILVSSFTNAASGEIQHRIATRSNVRLPKRPTGFGTVHSLCGKNITVKARKNAVSSKDRPKGCQYIGKDEGYYIDQIMLLAIKQVAFNSGVTIPNPVNMFTKKEIPFDPTDVSKGMQFIEGLGKSLETKGVPMPADILQKLKMVWEGYYGPSYDGYTGEFTGNAWKRGNPKYHNFMGKDISASKKIMSILNPTFSHTTGRWRSTKMHFSYAPKYNEGDSVSGEDVDVINEIFANLPNFNPYKSMKSVRIANVTSIRLATSSDSNPNKKPIKYFRKEEVKWWSESAVQWFNLGIDLVKLLKKKTDEDGKEIAIEKDVDQKELDNDTKKNLSKVIGQASRLIAVLKGKGISPTEAWYKVGHASDLSIIKQFDPMVAVYGAYEWLLGNTEQIPKDGDMTDIIIDSVRTLIADDMVRKDLQGLYKLILVDEAQDLNRVQHLFFGLIAGTIDPKTLEEKPASEMSASMYAMIGDDKQAIYGFQGADSGEMINKADLRGGDFKTNLITTNYRSGKNIVEMANQFIAYNEDQIPMTCKANTQKNGMGETLLHEVQGEDAKQEGASLVMQLMKEAKDQEDKSWGDFGVGVRTNAEGELYALMCLKNEIPFKGRYNPLNKKEYKGVLSFFKLAKYIITGSIQNPHSVIFDITRYPSSFITLYNKSKTAFMDYFNTKADPLKALINKSYQTETSFYHTQKRGQVSTMGKRVDLLSDEVIAFGKYIKAHGGGKVTSRQIHAYLFGDAKADTEPLLKRGGNTIVDSFKNEILEKATEISKLQTPGGDVSDEMVNTAAKEKVSAFEFLVRLGDVDEVVEGGYDEQVEQRHGTVFDLLNFTDEIENLKTVGEGDNTDSDDADAVRIMTCHGWKGLECDTMFVPCGQSWPRSDTTVAMTRKEIDEYIKDSFDAGGIKPEQLAEERRDLLVKRDEMESERRLMYVAMTRAEQKLHLIHTITEFQDQNGNIQTRGSIFFEKGEICIKPISYTRGKTSKLETSWGETIV